jgi:hypothetical protein
VAPSIMTALFHKQTAHNWHPRQDEKRSCRADEGLTTTHKPMKTILCFLSVLLVASTHLAGGESISFDLGPAANKDVIWETGGTASRFGENPQGHSAYVVQGYLDGKVRAKGLPADRKIKSATQDLGTYMLLPYDKKNVFELPSDAAAPVVSATIPVPPRHYRKIGLVVSAVDGNASMTIKLHYDDNTTTTHWWEADDWGTEREKLRVTQQPVINNMDRIRADTGQIETGYPFSLFEFVVSPDRTRVLKAITISNDPNRWPGDQRRWAGVFAINGAAAP